MEKHSVWQKRRICYGLLILFSVFFSASELNAAPLTNAQIRNLVIEPDKKEFFTAQENGYTICFDGIESSQIQTDLPALPPGVQFVSSKRSVFVNDAGERGTMIQFWFSFTDIGPVKLPPLIVQVNKRTFYLPFGDVTVYENPALISPELEVIFDEKTNVVTSAGGLKTVRLRTGEKLNFKVNIKYCVQIINYNWKLPENSIFNEIKRYEMAGGQVRYPDFSTESIPLAEFEWQPLVAGTFTLPHLDVKALSYNGYQKNIFMPACQVIVSGELNSQAANGFIPVRDIFSDAYENVELTSRDANQYSVSEEDCALIARLRSSEKHSIIFSSIRKDRKAFEEKIGIPDTEDEMNVPVIWVHFIIGILCLAAGVFFFVLRRYKSTVALFILALVFMLFSISSFISSSEQFGIYSGGKVWSVPETTSSNTGAVSAGIRVKVSQQAGEWLYIESANISGWVNKKSVVFIE